MLLSPEINEKGIQVSLDITKLNATFKHITLCTFLIYNTSYAETVPPLSGWNISTSDRNTTLLSKGTSSIEVWPWIERRDGLKNFVKKHQRLLPNGTKLESMGKHVNSEGLYSIARRIQYRKKHGVSFVTGCINGNFGRLLLLTAYNDSLEDLKTEGRYAQSICKSSPGNVADSERTTKINELTLRALGFSNESKLNGLNEVWHVGDFKISTLGMTPVWNTYLVFENGFATDDLESSVSLGAANAKNKYPDRWRRYKVVKESATHSNILFANSQGGFNRPFVSYQLQPASINEHLDGCWKSKKNIGKEIGNSDSGTTRTGFNSVTYCFQKNGDFKISSFVTASISGGNSSIKGSSVSNSSSGVSGKYNINNHLITLTTESGERGGTVFGWHLNEEGKQVIVIGNASYQPQ